MLKNIFKYFQKSKKAEWDKKSSSYHVCKCGCPVFEFEKMCPDCLRNNPIFDNSY